MSLPYSIDGYIDGIPFSYDEDRDDRVKIAIRKYSKQLQGAFLVREHEGSLDVWRADFTDFDNKEIEVVEFVDGEKLGDYWGVREHILDHICGHPIMSDSRSAYRYKCSECTYHDNYLDACEINGRCGLDPLKTGTEKQRRWAEVIRSRFAKTGNGFQLDIINIPSDSKWWIDNRDLKDVDEVCDKIAYGDDEMI